MNQQYIKKYDSKLVSLSSKKPIYYLENNPKIFVKIFNKEQIESMNKECELQVKGFNLGISPKVIDCYEDDDFGYFLMEKIDGKSLANMTITKDMWKQIHSHIYKLYYNDIHYVDITPYNFMIEANTNKIYVIDYGDAYELKVNWFLKDFIDGENSWNPDFE